MKVIKHENGVDLIPETDFEKECIKHISNKQLTAEFEDNWDQKGNLQLRFKPFEYGS